jgi:hypothetical protein
MPADVAPTSTQTAPASDAGAGAGAGAAPAGNATQAAPAAGAWSLDTWQPDQWDALPEPIRKAADTRYEGVYGPKLTAAQTSLTQHQADLAAARREVQDAKTAHMRGDSYGAQRVTEAQAELARLKTEGEAYRKEWNPERFAALEGTLAEKIKAAESRVGSESDAIARAELTAMFPWLVEKNGEEPNADHDGEKVAFATKINNIVTDPKVTMVHILKSAELNKAQRIALIQRLQAGEDFIPAFREASKPPKHTPSPAARAAPHAPDVKTSDPRPDQGMPRRAPSTGSIFVNAAERATRTVPNAR